MNNTNPTPHPTGMRHNIAIKSRQALLCALTLLLSVVGVGTMSARDFTAGETIYLNTKAKYNSTPESEGDWGSGAKIRVWLFGGSSADRWVEFSWFCGTLYKVDMPAGNWTKCIITRQNPSLEPGWDGVTYNKTGDIEIKDGNYLHTYKEGNTYVTWGSLLYSDGTTKFRFHQYPADWGFFGNDLGTKNYIYAYFKSVAGCAEHWSAAAEVYKGKILQVTIPAGIYESVILTRQDATKERPKWESVFKHNTGDDNESEIIPLKDSRLFDNQIYLHNFRQKGKSGEGWQWQAPPTSAPSDLMDTFEEAPREDINVCAEAITRGDPFTLTPIWNDAQNDYAYDESGAPIWWQWNNSSLKWELTANDFYDNLSLSGMEESLFYYMWTYPDRKKYRRFLHLKKTTCTIDCAITSMEVVASAVNVGDGTYYVDGLVAFTEASGRLIATCDGVTTAISSPTSPATFTLTLTADGAKDNIRVYFEGDPTCEATREIDAPSTTTTIIPHISTESGYYSPAKATYRHDEVVTLSHNAAATAPWDWQDTLGSVKTSGAVGADNTYTLPKFKHDTTIVVYYSEYNPAEETVGNLMGNSGYEEAKDSLWYSSISDYTYTGQWLSGSKQNVYEYVFSGDTARYNQKNGLWGITNNANRFWKRYAKIGGHAGSSKFATFDGDDTEKIAWSATTKDNTNLKIRQGTTYIFSFWVANINNYGELVTRDTTNCAILQFKIRCKRKDTGAWVEAFLGDSTNLNERLYRNNQWHQNSATFSTKRYFGEDFDADSVVISVVDKNKRGMRIGNDFALDDISFKAITTGQRTTRARERFEVNYVEPATEPKNLKVEWVTTPKCGDKDTCTIRVSFRYPKITTHAIHLELKDLVDGGYGTLVADSVLPKPAGVGDSTDYVCLFTSGSYPGARKRTSVKADAKAHNFQVKLTVTDDRKKAHGGTISKSTDPAPGIPALSITKADLVYPSCGGKTYNLKIDVNYTAQTGSKLKYYIDNVEKTSQDITYKVSEQTISNVLIEGLPADGKSHTLKVATGHALDCEDSKSHTAPKGNVVESFSIAPIDPICDATTYQLRATFTVSKSTADGSLYDNLMIKVGDGTPHEVAITASNATDGTYDLPETYAIAATHPTIQYYLKERTSTCAATASGYTTPVVPNITVPTVPTISDTACNVGTFTATWEVSYINQRGTMKAWLDSKTGDPQTYTITENTTTSSSVTISFSDLVADGSSHQLIVLCDGARSCERTSTAFTAPVRPVFKNADLTKTTPGFGVTTYDVTVSADLSNAKGRKLYIKSVDLDLDTQLSWDTTLAAAASGHISHTFKGIRTDNGKSHKFRIYFDDLKHCGQDLSYTSPDQREFHSFTVGSPSAVTCDGKFSIPFTIEAAEINGTLIIKDGSTPVYSALHNTITGSHTITENTSVNLTANGASHTLKAYFEGQTYAKTDTFETFTAPSAPTIAFADGTAILDCDGYVTVPLTVTFANQSATCELYIKEGSTTLKTFTKADIAAATSGELTWSWKFFADNTDHTLTAYFSDRTDCKKTVTIGKVNAGVFSVKPGVVPAMTCNTTTYTIHDTIIYRNMDTDAEVWLDDVKKLDVDVTNDDTNERKKVFDLTLTADSAEHTLQVKFTGRGAACSPKGYTFRAPFSPSIDNVTISGNEAKSCGDADTYTATVQVKTTNHRKALLCASINGGTPVKKKPADSYTEFSFAGLAANGDKDTIDVWFDCVYPAVDDECKTTKIFDAPLLPEVSIKSITIPTDVATCDQPKFDLTFDLTITNQDGELQVWVDDDKKAYKTFAPDVSDSESKYVQNGKTYTKTITLTGLPSDGGTHTVQYRFDKSGYCGYASALKSSSLTFPRSPTIDSVRVTDVADRVADCMVETYTANVKVWYRYTSGEKLIIRYTDKGGVERSTDPITLTANPQVKSLTLNDIGKGSKVLYAYFKDLSCTTTPQHTGAYVAPSNSTINSGYEVKVKENKSSCGNLLYDLTGTITYSGEAIANLIVKYDDKDSVIIAKSACSASGTTFVIPNLTKAAVGKTLTAYFFDQPRCTATSDIFNTPDTSRYDVPAASMSYSAASCNDTLTTLTFNLTYTYQSGTLKYWRDPSDKKTAAFKANNDTTFTIEGLTLGGYMADSLSHKLYVQFEGGRCSSVQEFTTPKTPYSPFVRDGITSETTAAACNTDTYTQSVTFYVRNSQNKKVTAICKEQTVTQVVHDGSNTINIPNVPRTLDVADDDFVEIYFPSADICSPRRKVNYTEHRKPQIVRINVDTPDEVDCGESSYTFKGSIDYVNLNVAPKVWLNNNEASAVTLDGVTLKSDDTKNIAITGISVPTTGTKDTIHVSAGGWTASCPIEQEFESVWRPLISEVTATTSVTYAHCDGSYDVSGSVTYSHGNLQDLVVECYGQTGGMLKKATYHTTKESGSVPYKLEGLEDIGEKVDTIKAYFVGTDRCETLKQTYKSPIKIVLSSFSVTAQPKTCDKDTFTVTGAVTSNHADENITIWYDATHTTTITSKVGENKFAIKGFNTTGNGKEIKAYYTGHSCSEITTTFNTPVKPTIDTLNVSYSKPACNVTTTDLTFKLKYTNQSSTLKLYLNGVEQTYTRVSGDAPSASDSEKEVTLKITGLKADSLSRTLRVQFVGDKCCDKEYTLPATPFSPAISSATASMSDIACGSDTYTLNVSFNVTNSQNKKVTIRFKGTDYLRSTTDGTNTFSFTGISRNSTTPADETVEIFYASATNCSTHTTATYTETPVPALGITIAANQGSVACDKSSYTLQGTIDYTYLDQYPKVTYKSTTYDLSTDAYKSFITLNSTTSLHFDLSKLNISVPADSSSQTLSVAALGRASACGTISESFKTLWRPAVTGVSASLSKSYVHCDETYTDTIKISYERGVAGKKIFATCEDNSTTKSGSATLENGSGVATIILTGLKETGDATHNLTLYFEGFESSCPITSYSYAEPTQIALSEFTVSALRRECDKDTFSLVGSISSNHAGEKITVWYDADHNTTINSCVAGVNKFSIKDLEVNGTGLGVKAYFTEHNTGDCSKVTQTFSTYVKPTIDTLNVSYSKPACNVTTTDLTFKLKYTNQSSTLKLYLNGVEQTYTRVSGDAPSASDSEKEVTLKITGLKADSLSRTLRVQFVGDKCCDKEYTLPATPFSPAISSATASMSDIACGSDTYTLNVSFNVTNSQNKKVTIRFKGTDYLRSTTDGTNTFSFTGISRNSTTPADETVEIFYASATNCSTHTTATYTETPVPALAFTIPTDQGTIACNAENYTLQGSFDYMYINELPEIWLDDKTHIHLTSGQVTLSNASLRHVDLKDLSISVPTDGKAHHLYVKADGWSATCGTVDSTFTSVWRPQVTSVTPSLSKSYIHCGDKYDLTLTINYERGISGKKIYASCEDNETTVSNSAVLADGTSTATIVLKDLTEIGHNSHALHIYFEGLEAVCPIDDKTYAEPTMIVFNSFNVTAQPKNCDDVSYTVTGELTTNTTPSLDIYVKDANSNSVKATHKSGNTYEYSLSGVTVTGASKHLTAYFEGKEACYTKTSDNTFSEPAKPTAALKNIQLKTPACDVTTFTLTFDLDYTYQDADSLIIWVDDSHKKVLRAVDDKFTKASSESLTVSDSITDLPAIGATGQKLYYKFTGSHSCADSESLGKFPVTPIISDVDVDCPDKISCSEGTYNATVKVNTTYAAGERLIVKYLKANRTPQYTTATAVPSANYTEIAVTFDKKDGYAHDTIYVYFDGDKYADCREMEAHRVVFNTPSSSSINDFEVTVHDYATCDQLLYSLTGTITYGGTATGDMIISFDDLHTKDTVISQANCNPAGTPFTMSGLTKPVSGYKISAHFDGESCLSHSQEFSSPILPKLIDILIPAEQGSISCDATQYALKGTIHYVKLDKIPYLSLDGGIKRMLPGVTLNSVETKSMLLDTLNIKVPTDGKPHHLVFKIDDWNASCAVDSMFTAVWRPQISEVTANRSVDFAHCDGKYSVSGKVSFSQGNKQSVVVECYGASGLLKSATYPTTAIGESGDVEYTLTDLTDIGEQVDTIKAYFAGTSICNASKQTKTYKSPATIKLSAFSATAQPKTCDKDTFTVTGKVSSNHAGESITIKYDDTHTATIASSVKGENTFAIRGFNTTGSDLPIVAYFTGHNTESCSEVTAHFDTPVKPTISISDVAYSNPECNVTTTDLTFKLKYTKQSSTLKLYLNSAEQTYIIEAGDALSASDSEQEVTLKIAGLAADSLTRTLRVEFVGDKCCDKTFDLVATPFSPKITNAKATMTDIVCGNNQYKLKVDFHVANSQNKQATIRFRGVDYKCDTHDGDNSYSIPSVTRQAVTPAEDSVKIFYASASYCTKPVKATYIETPVPSLALTISADQGTIACNAESYTLQGSLDYSYINALPEIWLDNNTHINLTESQVTLSNASPLHVDLKNLSISVPTDGKTHHLYVKAGGWTESCATVESTFIAVWRPQISAVTANRSVDYAHCDDKYNVSGKVTFSQGNKQSIVVECYGASGLLKSATYPTAAIGESGDVEYTLTDLPDIGEHVDTIKAYFVGTNRCETLKQTYKSPILKTLQLDNIHPNTINCGDPAFSISGTVVSNVSNEDVIVSDGHGHEDSFNLSERTTFTIGGLTSGGKIAVKFKNHECSKTDSVDFANQSLRPIPTLTLSDAAAQCYPAGTFSIGYGQSNAQTIHYTVKLGSDAKLSNSVEVTSAIGTFTITVDETWNHGVYSVIAYAESPADCSSLPDTATFEIYPQPRVTSFEPLAAVRETTDSVVVKFHLEHADTYDYEFINKNHVDVLQSKTGVAASKDSIVLTTKLLTEGKYALIVTPKSSHCDGKVDSMHVTINNKPSIDFTKPADVCVGTDSIKIKYAINDAKTFTYWTHKDGVRMDESDKTIQLAEHPSPWGIRIADWTAGTYTISGFVTSDKSVKGDTSSVSFKVVAQPTIVSVSKPKAFIGCNETYSDTIVANIFNAGGKTIYAEYKDGNEIRTAHANTHENDATATIILPNLTDTDGTEPHKVKVYIDGLEDCGVDTSYIEPQAMKIIVVSAICKPKACGVENDTVYGGVWTNGAVGTIRAEAVDDPNIHDDMSMTDDTTYQLIIPAGGSHQVRLYFVGKGCDPFVKEYTPTVKPQMDIRDAQYVEPKCDSVTTTLTFNLAYTKQNGTLNYWVDNLSKHSISYNVNQDASDTLKNLRVHGVPADGKAHKLYVQFNHALGCYDSVTVSAPQQPVLNITSTKQTKTNLNCGESYSAKVYVDYSNGLGKRIYVSYNDSNKTRIDSSAVLTKDNGSDSITLQPLYDSGTDSKSISVYFGGFEGCPRSSSYTLPVPNTINYFSADASRATCDSLYSVSGTIKFNNGDGDLVVFYDDTHRDTILHPVDSAHYEITDMRVSGQNLQLTAYFTGAKTCTVQSDKFNAPVVPWFDTLNVQYDVPACGDTLTRLRFSIPYRKQRGEMTVKLDGNPMTYLIIEGNYTQDLSTNDTMRVALPDMLADGKTHKVTVEFSDGCSKSFDMPAAPFSPKVTSAKAEISNIACNSDKYKLTLTYTVNNHQGKDATIVFRDETRTIATHNGKNEVVYNVARTYENKNDDYITIYYNGRNTYCLDGVTSYPTVPDTVWFEETPKPNIALHIADSHDTVCGAETYRLHGHIEYQYIDSLPEVWLDDSAHITLPAGNISLQDTARKSFNLIHLPLYVPTDGKTHTLHVSAGKWMSSCPINRDFTAIWRPEITAVKHQLSDTMVHCNQTYNDTVTVLYKRGNGQKLYARYTDGGVLKKDSVTTTAEEGAATIILPKLTDRNHLSHGVEVFFAGADSCVHHSQYTAADSLRMLTFTAEAQPKSCDDATYTVTGEITTNATPDSVIIVKDANGNDTIARLVSENKYEYTLTGVTVTGTDHRLTAYFKDMSCSEMSSQDTFDEPTKPTASVLSVTPIQPACDDTTFTLKFALSYTYQPGDLTVWLDSLTADKAQYKKNIHIPDSLRHVSARTLQDSLVDLSANGSAGHVLHYMFAGNHACSGKLTDIDFPNVPFINKVEIIEKTERVDCDNPLYEFKVVTSYLRAENKRIVIEYKDSADNRIAYSSQPVTGSGTDTVKITGLRDMTPGTHNLYAYFEGETTERCKHAGNHIGTYAPPSSSAIQNGFPVQVTNRSSCGNLLYDLSGTVRFEGDKHGDIIVKYDDEHLFTIRKADCEANTDLPYTITGISSYDPNKLLEAYFSEVSNCLSYSDAISEPIVPALVDITIPADQGTVLCEAPTFPLKGKLRYVNIDAAPYLSLDGSTPRYLYGAELHSTDTLSMLLDTMAINVPTDGKEHHLKLMIDGWNTSCAVDSVFTAIWRPEITNVQHKLSDTLVHCDRSYNDTITVTYLRGNKQNLFARYTDGGIEKTTSPVSTTADDSTATIILENLSDRNHQPHEVEVFFAGVDSCAHRSQYTAADSIQILTFTQSVYAKDCNAVEYTIGNAITTNCAGQEITIELANGQTMTVTSTGGVQIFDFEHVTSPGANQIIKAYFTGHDCSTVTNTFSEPAKPVMAFGAQAIATDDACADSTYTLTVPVSYTFQLGKMYAQVSGQAAQEITAAEGYVAENEDSQTATITFTGLLADGNPDTVRVWCDGQHACSLTGDNALIVPAPYSPVIDSVVVTRTEPTFGVLTYDATVRVYTRNFRNNSKADSITVSADIIDAVTGNPIAFSDTVPANGVWEHTYTGLPTENGIVRTFTAQFNKRNCPKSATCNTPDQRKFQSMEVTRISEVACDSTYSIDIRIIASEISGTLVITDEADGTLYSASHNTIGADNNDTIRLTLSELHAPMTAMQHTLHATFLAQTYSRGDTTEIYTAPAAPIISMVRATETPNVDCNGTVHLPLTVSFANQTGDLVVRDNNHELIVSISATDLAGLTSITVNWSYPADSSTTRTAYAYFRNRSACLTLPVASVVKKQPSWSYTTHHSTIDCEGYYSDTLHFTWSHANGYFVVDSIVSGGSHLCYDNSASGSFTRILTGLHVTDDPAQRYRIYFSTRANDCDSIITSIPQHASVLDTFYVSARSLACDSTRYTVDLHWDYTMATDSLYIEDESHNILWRDSANAKHAQLTFLLTAGEPLKSHTFCAYFKDKGYSCRKSYAFREPAMPHMDTTGVHYTVPACNETTDSLVFVLRYTKQQGNLHVALNGAEQADTIMDRVLELNYDRDTLVQIAIPNLKAHGAVDTLHVWFDGANSCDKTYILPAAPFSPRITNVKVDTITDVTCGNDSVTLVVSYRVENGQNAIATIESKDIRVTRSVTDGLYSDTLRNVPRTYPDKTDDTVMVSIPATYCTAAQMVTFNQVPRPELLGITIAESQTSCGSQTYPLQGSVRYINASGVPQLWLDDDELQAVALTGTITHQGDTTTVVFYTGIDVPADGYMHTLHLKADGTTAQCPISTTFKALQQPLITSDIVITQPTAYISCGETYSASVSMSVMHADGKKLYVAYQDSTIDRLDSTTVAAGATQALIPLTGLHDVSGSKSLTIYFEDELYTCSTAKSFVMPELNKIEPFDVITSANPCGTVDYTLSGTVKFNNAFGLGNLIVKFDDKHADTISITNPTDTTADFRIEHMDREGREMQLTAYFAGWPDCVVASNMFDSPKVPELSADITAIDTVFWCSNKQYNITLSITAANQVGSYTVTDSIVGGSVRTFTDVDTFSIALPNSNETHYVIVRYPATGCEFLIPATIFATPYVKPEPVISLTPIARLCNSETEINIPLVIEQGDIHKDSVTLTLLDSKGNDLPTGNLLLSDNRDTLSFTLLSTPAAGTYTAIVEAKDTLGCADLDSLQIEFAQEGVVFSKWTDVLLVDNAEGLYTGYQWYENGVALEGKTEQTLYLPDGMNGTYTCRLTTEEGMIFTCEYAFSDIPRSADNPPSSPNHITVLPNRVHMGGSVTVQQSELESLHLVLLSATGQRIAELTQTESKQLVDMPSVQGVYMLRIESSSGVQAVKIVVY